jgi:hypothetical protein
MEGKVDCNDKELIELILTCETTWDDEGETNGYVYTGPHDCSGMQEDVVEMILGDAICKGKQEMESLVEVLVRFDFPYYWVFKRHNLLEYVGEIPSIDIATSYFDYGEEGVQELIDLRGVGIFEGNTIIWSEFTIEVLRSMGVNI